jgi:hypothetical protein
LSVRDVGVLETEQWTAWRNVFGNIKLDPCEREGIDRPQVASP